MKLTGSALLTVWCGVGTMALCFLPAGSQSVPVVRTGNEIYQQRCSVCHDHPQESIPPKDFLMSRTQDYIVNALTNGVMQGQASGLSASEVSAVARYLATASSAANSSEAKLQEPDLHANPCTRAAPPITLDGSWNGFGPNLDNARFQPKPGFRVEDIPRLKPKWTWAYPGGTTGGPPSVAGGRVFVGTATGSIVSLDVETGCMYWAKVAGRMKVPVTVAIWTTSHQGKGSPTRAVGYFGDRKAVVHALDAVTGETIWETKVDENDLATISGALTLDQATIYVPVTSSEGSMGPRGDYPCCSFRGSMVALDSYTGKILWKSYTISEIPRPFKLNGVGTQMYGPAGVGIWSPPTVDPIRKVVYGATAESKTAMSVDTSDAILAFDMKTGGRVWAKQATANDNWIQGCEARSPAQTALIRWAPMQISVLRRFCTRFREETDC